MKLFVAIFGSLFLLAVAACCVFGFLATFKPTDNTAQFMAFRVGYAVIGLGCRQRLTLTCGRGERFLSCVGRFPRARTVHNKR